MSAPPPSDDRHLPSGGLRRSAKLLSLPLGIAGRNAVGLGKRLTGQSPKDVSVELREATAEQMFAVLGELKGGAMKVGQLWSMLVAALPEEEAVPYRDQLRRLQATAPPMPTSRVQAVLSAEFGADWKKYFSSLVSRPSAAASIGQVHKGVWKKTGQTVAVKVQYPGADEALQSDLKILERIAGMMGPLVGGMDVRAVAREVAQRTTEETDYRREAQAQQQAALAFEDDRRFFVPKVLAHTSKVLVSEWVEGKALTSAENADPTERNRVGLQYAEFLFRSPAQAKLLHGDPHPGNFLLLEDGRMAVVDWGLADRLPEGLPETMGRLLRLAADGHIAETVKGLRAEGFVTRDVSAQDLYEYLRPFVEPAIEPQFHFSRAWMGEQLDRLGQDTFSGANVVTKLNLPPEWVLIDRVWVSAVAVLCALDCTAPFRPILDKYLPGWHTA